MYLDTKGSVRIVMPNGKLTFDHVQRVVVGKVLDPNHEWPKFYFRSIRIETADGSIEILMEAVNPRLLQMESEGGLIATLKKQVAG
jgi:hypothetical protein